MRKWFPDIVMFATRLTKVFPGRVMVRPTKESMIGKHGF